MRILNHILICIILFICSVGFVSRLDAATKERTTAVSSATGALAEIPDGPPLIQEQKITISPFFRLHSNGSKVWVERLLVTFMVAAPKNCLPDNLDNPTLRKTIYDLLQSGETAATIQTQAVTHVQRQTGMKLRPTVQISRSVLIVR
ncbi:MAG: hypothetical protein P8X65_12240 [Syntrophobacterales bacterium]|jgi:hypothetical protein